MKVSCVIPVYNEAPRVEYVVNNLLKVKNIEEIICIDDGSADESFEILSKFKNIRVIKHEINKGKCEAIRTGINASSGEYILLMDADLINIQSAEIEDTIDRFFHVNPTPDMLIFRRKNDPFLARLVRNDIIVTGERLINKRSLEQILQTNIKGYELEYAINKFMIDNKKEVNWSVSSAYNTMKVQKMSFLNALRKELNMFLNIWILNNGLIKYNILNQMLFFHPEQLK